MNKYNILEEFFANVEEYKEFLTFFYPSLKAIIDRDGVSMALLKKKGDYFEYSIIWRKTDISIIEFVKRFPPTQEYLDIFNEGVKILSERLVIYIDTEDYSQVPEDPPAFGNLTHILEEE